MVSELLFGSAGAPVFLRWTMASPDSVTFLCRVAVFVFRFLWGRGVGVLEGDCGTFIVRIRSSGRTGDSWGWGFFCVSPSFCRRVSLVHFRAWVCDATSDSSIFMMVGAASIVVLLRPVLSLGERMLWFFEIGRGDDRVLCDVLLSRCLSFTSVVLDFCAIYAPIFLFRWFQFCVT